MSSWIKIGVAAGALAVFGCQDRNDSQVDQQGWKDPGEGTSASKPVEELQGQDSAQQDTSGYGGSGDTNLNTDQPINGVGPESAQQPTPDGFGEDTANSDRSTMNNSGEASGTSMGTTEPQPGTGGSGDEGSGDATLPPDSAEQTVPSTADEPRPDEKPALEPGTGGAGGEDERSEGGTGTEQVLPGETDAKTGQQQPEQDTQQQPSTND